MPTTSTNTCTKARVAVTIQGRRAAQSCFDPQLGPDSIGGHGVSHSSHSRQQSHCVSHTVVTLAVTVQPDQWTINRESLFVPLFQCEAGVGGREVWIQHHGNIPLADILQRYQQRHTEYVDTAAACHVSKQVIVRCWRCWGGPEVRGQR